MNMLTFDLKKRSFACVNFLQSTYENKFHIKHFFIFFMYVFRIKIKNSNEDTSPSGIITSMRLGRICSIKERR